MRQNWEFTKFMAKTIDDIDLEELAANLIADHPSLAASSSTNSRPISGQDAGITPGSDPENANKGIGGGVIAIPGGHLEQLLAEMPSTAGAPTAEEENETAGATPGATPGGRWEPKQLNARHREIMRRLLEGANYLTIAEEMGIHHQTVMLVATSSIFKTELAKMEASADFVVVKRADELANEALDNLKLIMRHSRSDANRRNASMDILGIAGYSKIERKIVGIVSAEDVIKELNKRKRGIEESR